MNKKFNVKEFKDIKEEVPDIEIPIDVININFDIEPISSTYFDGAFWLFDPLFEELKFALAVTHWKYMSVEDPQI